MQIADILKNREVYEKLGVSSPKGLFIHGVPGVGKSLMANAVIEASGRPFFICRKNQPDGDFVNTIMATFEAAVKNAPSIVFLDDMDKFANTDERCRDAEEYVTVQSCIDAVKDKEVFVIATANNQQKLPRSLLRPGRFDRILEIDAPHGKDALSIITHYLSQKKFVSSMDVNTIAKIMDGRSCAALETVLNEAGLCAGYERKVEITMDHFMQACLRTIYHFDSQSFNGEQDDDIDFSDAMGKNADTIYHEAGHAVISEVLCPGSVTLVYICGSDRGFTSYYCDRAIPHMQWEQSRIITSLGGKAALEQNGVACVGCYGDLQQAFDILKGLVKKQCICGFQFFSYDGYGENSDRLLAKQEQVTASEMERYYRIAKQILALNKEFYDEIVNALTAKRMLIMTDIQEIKRRCKITEVSVL